GMHFDFDNSRRIGIGRRRSYAAAFVESGRFRRSVRADRADGSEARFCEANRFRETDSFLRRGGIEYALVGKTQSLFRQIQFQRNGFGKQRFSAFRRLRSEERRVGSECEYWLVAGADGAI